LKKLVLIFINLLLSGYSQVTPCEDYACDSLAVRAVLDSNGRTDVLVKDVAVVDTSDGRIIALQFGSSDLTNLPSEIGNLTELTFLNLINNQLTSLPAEIGKLTELAILYILNNQLTSLPTEIGNFDSLNVLWLGNNQLTSIPSEIGNLKSLTILYLYDNKLNIVPSEIGNLTALTELNLSNNQLTRIPPEIGNLTELNFFNIPNNLLTELPPEIIQLDLSIWLDENFLCSLPDSIANWVDTSSSSTDWIETQRLDETHNCDGTGNAEPLPSGDNKISIHNTPFTGQVTIYIYNSHAKKSLSIYNTGGKLIKRFEGIQESITWKTEGQGAGIYYLKAVINKKVIVRKFMLD